MKLSAIVLDYDGTIAIDGVMDPAIRPAIGAARDVGIAVVLATGRRTEDLRRVAGDLACFDVVVAENGGILEFPGRQHHMVLAHPPPPAILAALTRRGIPFTAGETLIESDAASAPAIMSVLHELQQPHVLCFNRGRVMVLPPAIGKSTGVPHRIVVDEAHYLLAGMSRSITKALALDGVTLVSYRVSLLRDALSLPDDAVVPRL